MKDQFKASLINIAKELMIHPAALAYMWEDLISESKSTNAEHGMSMLHIDKDNALIYIINDGKSDIDKMTKFVKASTLSPIDAEDYALGLLENKVSLELFISDFLSDIVTMYASDKNELYICEDCDLIHDDVESDSEQDMVALTIACPYCGGDCELMSHRFYFTTV